MVDESEGAARGGVDVSSLTGVRPYKADPFEEAERMVDAVMRAWSWRRSRLRAGAKIVEFRDDPFASKPTMQTVYPTISDVQTWCIDVEIALKAIGQESTLVLHDRIIARLPFAEISERHRLVPGSRTRNARAVYRAAVSAFEQELRRRGITSNFMEYRAAA